MGIAKLLLSSPSQKDSDESVDLWSFPLAEALPPIKMTPAEKFFYWITYLRRRLQQNHNEEETFRLYSNRVAVSIFMCTDCAVI